MPTICWSSWSRRTVTGSRLIKMMNNYNMIDTVIKYHMFSPFFCSLFDMTVTETPPSVSVSWVRATSPVQSPNWYRSPYWSVANWYRSPHWYRSPICTGRLFTPASKRFTEDNKYINNFFVFITHYLPLERSKALDLRHSRHNQDRLVSLILLYFKRVNKSFLLNVFYYIFI